MPRTTTLSTSTTTTATTTTMIVTSSTNDDPSIPLPRDATGSYLHLKLKRYRSIEDLTMNFAKKTWREIPQDAEVDEAPTTRSSCRHCHQRIEKGTVRFRLFLQCHKGCKIGAYFHGSGDTNNKNNCIWKYPETQKLESVNEIKGLSKLSDLQQSIVKMEFSKMKESALQKRKGDEEENEEGKPSPMKKRRLDKEYLS
jgi:hypothetical protein